MEFKVGLRIARKLVRSAPLQGLWFLMVWLSPALSTALLFYLSYTFRSTLHDQPLLLLIAVLASVPLLASGLIVSTSLCVALGYVIGWQAMGYLVPAYLLAAYMGRAILGNWWTTVFQAILADYPSLSEKMHFFHLNAFLTVISTRVMPVLPFALMNVAYSFLKISPVPFYLGSALGMIPRAVLSVWAGLLAYQAQQDPGYFLSHQQYSIALFALFCLGFIGLIVLFRQRNRT